MIVDLDDLHEKNHRLDLLVALREANPLFRATVWAIPYLSPDEFLESLPEWLEVGVHGFDHRHLREAADWSKEKALDVLLACSGRFVDGFKAPGYAISDGTYEALFEMNWFVADQAIHDVRRPKGLRAHRAGDGEHWHMHIQGGRGDSLQGMFPRLLERVREAPSFELMSEAAVEWWPHPVAA